MTASRVIVLAALLAGMTPAKAADCPRDGTLGTARVLSVDAASTPRVGLKSFPDTLPLEDKEVVLTFDDGPAQTTPQVLAALAHECVQATFFMVGTGVTALPTLVRRVAAAGHSIGTHTWSHKNLKNLPPEQAAEEIDRGITALETVLHGKASTVPTTPFFRFPYFDSTPALLERLQARGIVVFGADFWASDWNRMTPQEQLALITERLEANRKGIILFHDPRAQTAAMLPDFLRYLRENHYRVVHVVAKAPEANVTH
ncbi:MAG TPA: polysaccharide deacetylase family protein [Rhodopseudomonas sp.]|uniref:polysaccharide deacetylase family protein n=1 Tax=Rhodopseudomonas sp. TaxID=1078 RepID=UPI002ED943A5